MVPGRSLPSCCFPLYCCPPRLKPLYRNTPFPFLQCQNAAEGMKAAEQCVLKGKVLVMQFALTFHLGEESSVNAL